MSSELPPKLGSGDLEHSVPFAFSDVWTHETVKGVDRLRIGPSKNYVELLLTLANLWQDWCRILYVLLVPRLCKRDPGRYEAPDCLSMEEVERFCRRFKHYLEGDARHHLWISSANDAGLLVYDRHQWIYAYGDLASYLDVLKELGYVEGSTKLPSPHTHHYNAAFDAEEDELIAYWDWIKKPLQPEDET